jgi:hypothetical protein
MPRVFDNMEQDSLPALRIDHVLAQHYGFTEDALDFIINYDIKYRMGKDSEEDNNGD